MNKVEQWQDVAARLKALKTEEADLRRDLAAGVIGEIPMKNGRVTVRGTYEGIPVKAVQELGYTLDLAALASVWNDLSPEDKEAIKLKPTLQTGKYKKLEKDSLLHEAVITKLSMPTFEVSEVKV
jgi:hypothetical protein